MSKDFYDVFGPSAGAQTIRQYLEIVDTVAGSLGPREVLTKDMVYSIMAEVIRDGTNAGWIPEQDRTYFHTLAREFDRAADSIQLQGIGTGVPETAENLVPTQGGVSALEIHGDMLRYLAVLGRQANTERTDRDGKMGELTWAETVKMAARALQFLQKGLLASGIRSRVLRQVEDELWNWASQLGEGRISGTLGDPSVMYDPTADNPWSQAGA